MLAQNDILIGLTASVKKRTYGIKKKWVNVTIIIKSN